MKFLLMDERVKNNVAKIPLIIYNIPVEIVPFL